MEPQHHQDPNLEKLDRKTDAQWRRLSNQVIYFRSQKKSCHSNQRLHSVAGLEPQSPLAPLLHLWRSDNFSKDARFAEAVKSYDQAIIASQSAGKFLHNQDIIPGALTHKAQAFVLQGDLNQAMATYHDLIKYQPSNKNAALQAGIIAERLGNYALASDYYQQIASPELSKHTDDPAQLARRAIDRLNSSTVLYHPSAEQLAATLTVAIEKKDTSKLIAMVSKTHFSVGLAGTETVFEDAGLVNVFISDLLLGNVKVNPALLGTGEKKYLTMTGFKGKSFRGHIALLMTRAPRGWEWTAIVLQSPTRFWTERWQSGAIQNKLVVGDDSVPFDILAPWPKPLCFTAGGLEYFLTMESIVVAGGLFGFVLATILATKNCCGYGPRGYYYHTAPTHDENEAFAIDFTRYKENVPYVNESGGTSVLAVRDGVVGPVTAGHPSGNTSEANSVVIKHDDPANPGELEPKYISRYLHLDGPFTINVSELMPVRVGTLLGYMDDTGNSAMDHLHFSIHNPAGQSVRPSPMGGVTLNDSESGKCVKSTNLEHKGTNFMLSPSSYTSSNWIIAPAAFPVNEATPVSVANQQFTLTLSGVAIIDFKGVDADWAQDTVLLQPDIRNPIFFAVGKYHFPIPAGAQFTPQFEVDQYALHATLSSIHNQGDSVNAGYAVDNWQAHPFAKDTDVITGTALSNLFNGMEVDIAVSDSDGQILRLSYHIILLGKIRFGQPIVVL